MSDTTTFRSRSTNAGELYHIRHAKFYLEDSTTTEEMRKRLFDAP